MRRRKRHASIELLAPREEIRPFAAGAPSASFFTVHQHAFRMDTVICTGSIPLEEFKVDGPRAREQLVADGDVDRFH